MTIAENIIYDSGLMILYQWGLWGEERAEGIPERDKIINEKKQGWSNSGRNAYYFSLSKLQNF